MAAFILFLQARQAGRDLLWKFVHEDCVPHAMQNKAPEPCVEVDLSGGVERGYAVLKDIRGPDAFLVIPTARLTGIESPSLLEPGAPNFFSDAWRTRSQLEDAVHQALPREDVGLAINSAVSRSQDQLHIHVECVQPGVQKRLQLARATIRTSWAPVTPPLLGHPYEAMWVGGESLRANPFELLADGIPGAVRDMGDYTLAVIGLENAAGAPGFVVLEDRAVGWDHAEAEELLDRSCDVAAVPAHASGG